MQVVLLTDVTSVGYGKYAGTYKIATEIRAAGYTCQVIDNVRFLGLNRLKALVDKFVGHDTLAVGMSCTLNETRDNNYKIVSYFGITNDEFKTLVDYIRSKSNAKIIIGGARVHEEIDSMSVDYAVIGKADNAIIAMLKSFEGTQELKYTSNKFTKIVRGDDYFYSQDEFKESKILFAEQDIILANEWLPLEIARGCIFSCSFCAFDLIGKKMGDWTKTADAIYEEMMRNYNLFGTTSYMFTDELINESVEKLEMLLSVVNRLPFSMKYTAYVRLDRIAKYPKMAKLLLDTGAVSVAIGIESLNYDALKKAGKGLHPDIIKKTLRMCKDTWGDNVIISSSFIVGLPEETEQSVRETFDYLISEDCPIDIFNLIPLGVGGFTRVSSTPKSKLEKNPEKYGFIIKKNSFEWQNTNQSSISQERAGELVAEFRRHPAVKSNIFYSSTLLGRILTLGFSINDVFRILRSKDDNEIKHMREEIYGRSRQLKNRYFFKLLEL